MKNNYISLSEAAKRLQITRQALYKKMNDDPMPSFFVDVRQDGDTRSKPAWRVDVTNKEWQELEAQYRETADLRALDSMSKSDGQKLALEAKRLGNDRPVKKKKKKNKSNKDEDIANELKKITHKSEHETIDRIKNNMPQLLPELLKAAKKELQPAHGSAPVKKEKQEIVEVDMLPEKYDDPEDTKLHNDMVKAKKKREIYLTEINKEKAAQQQILTLEKKREIAPVSMIQHFFSFGENLIQRIYRRPHEISPQLAALYQAHEDKKAEQLLIRELESIVVDSQKELLKAMKDEGYRLHNENKKNKKGKK